MNDWNPIEDFTAKTPRQGERTPEEGNEKREKRKRVYIF
jgi:hypothetical protein